MFLVNVWFMVKLSMVNYSSLPRSIKRCFKPFETIAPSDYHYIAKPRFIGYPPNHLKGWMWTYERTASEDGSSWLVRQYSPSSHNCCYDVIFCRLDNSLDHLVELTEQRDTANLANLLGVQSPKKELTREHVLALALLKYKDPQTVEKIIERK